MDPAMILREARSALESVAGRTQDLVRSLTDLRVPIPGSEWSVREAGVHLVTGAALFADIATGIPSPVRSVAEGAMARENAQRIADIPEGDPEKLARLIEDAVRRFLDVTAGGRGDEEVVYHCGTRIGLAQLVCISLGEQILHGYDIAIGTGCPWPIDPDQALLVLSGYAPIFRLVVDQGTAQGHTAGYRIDLRGGPSLTVRFVDGQFSLEPPDSEPIDCTISADPVAFLLLSTGRLSQWPAIALGLLGAGGPKPELALGFGSLFSYP